MKLVRSLLIVVIVLVAATVARAQSSCVVSLMAPTDGVVLASGVVLTPMVTESGCPTTGFNRIYLGPNATSDTGSINTNIVPVGIYEMYVIWWDPNGTTKQGESAHIHITIQAAPPVPAVCDATGCKCPSLPCNVPLEVDGP